MNPKMKMETRIVTTKSFFGRILNALNLPALTKTVGLFGLGILLSGCSYWGDRSQPAAVDYLISPAMEGMDLPFSGATRVGNLIFVSGNIGNPPGKLELVEGGIEAETRQTLENIRAVLERHGSSLNDVVKCTVMMADMSEWPKMNEVYTEFFTAPYPARSALGANGLALGARVEIECIAVVR